MKRYDGETHIVQMLVPTPSLTGSGSVQGDWVSLRQYDSLTIVYSSDVGSAGQDVNVTIRQATDAAGAGAKNLGAGQWYAAQNATPGSLGDKLAAVGSAGTFLDDGETACVARCEVTGDQLDVENHFEFVQIRAVRTASGSGKVGSVVGVLRGGRYEAAVPDQPTALA